MCKTHFLTDVMMKQAEKLRVMVMMIMMIKIYRVDGKAIIICYLLVVVN